VAEDFSILRRIILNLLRQNKFKNTGIKNRRLLAGWNEAHLEKKPRNSSHRLMRLPCPPG
jgi:hypothetical protein